MILDFFAETFNVNVHRSGVSNVLISPDMVQQLLPGKYLVGRGGQKIQQLQLLGRHLNGMAVVDDRVIGQVHN